MSRARPWQVPGLWPHVLSPWPVPSRPCCRRPLAQLPLLEQFPGQTARRLRALLCSARCMGRHIAVPRRWRQGWLSRVSSETLPGGEAGGPGGRVGRESGERAGARSGLGSPRTGAAPAFAWRAPRDPSARPIGAAAGAPGPSAHRRGGRVNAQPSEVRRTYDTTLTTGQARRQSLRWALRPAGGGRGRDAQRSAQRAR